MGESAWRRRCPASSPTLLRLCGYGLAEFVVGKRSGTPFTVGQSVGKIRIGQLLEGGHMIRSQSMEEKLAVDVANAAKPKKTARRLA